MVVNMDFNVAALLLSLFLLIYCHRQYDITKKSGRYLMYLIACVCIPPTLIMVCSYLLYLHISETIIYILYSIHLFFTVLCAFALVEYVRACVHSGKNKNIYYIINHVAITIFAIACLANIPLHFFITISDTNIIRGKAYILIFALSAYYLLFAFFSMIKYFKVLNKRQTLGVISFVVLTWSGAMLQYFCFHDRYIIYFIYALSCLILLSTFETPDYIKLMATTDELKVSNDKLTSYKQREVNMSKTIHQLMKTSSWEIYFDDDGNMTDASWSEEIRPLLGYSPEDEIDIATLWVESLHPDDKDIAMKAFANGLSGQDYRIETRLRYKDGSYHWFLCTGSLNKNSEGKPESYKGIIQNIDDEIYKRELIIERLKAMSDLEKSQVDLKKALLAAQEASRAKTTFLSNMSHDIRTPMNAIIGYVQLAKEHISDKDELLECLNTIHSSGDHLLSLINDVLDMSRIESGKVKVEAIPCDISEMVHEVEMLTKANVSEKKQNYETVIENLTDPYVMCDRLRLNQVLINCVGNSVKYTKEGGQIKVLLSQSGNEYTFKIIDNGIGMSEEFLEHVFEPFERSKDPNASSIQGTGLGMAITKNLVQMMGGKIKAESKLGEGSTFIITLPLTAISKEEYKSSKETVSDEVPMDEMISFLSGKKFLVVDDNKINRTVVTRLLGDRGMIIDECDSGLKAIEIASTMAEGTYDMIFMDVQMPVMNGNDATKAIRSLDSDVAKSIPIVAMTANAFEEDRKIAEECGMSGHITKPFKIDELIRMLYGMLK